MDSDFSIDENDEPVSENEDEKSSRKKLKRTGVVTKSYKEPPAKKSTVTPKPTKPASPKKTPSKSVVSNKKGPGYTVFDSGRKSHRRSTALKTAATVSRMKQRCEDEKKKKKQVKVTEYIPTQEELLAEAMETEKENVKSLEKFMRLEMEKKRTRPTKRQSTGPIIRYHSTSLPLIEDLDGKTIDLNIQHTSPVKSEPMDVDTEETATVTSDAGGSSRARAAKRSRPTQRAINAIKNGPRYERTFITFENDVHEKLFDEIFKRRSVSSNSGRRERGKICPITKLPARYFDPVTKVPYRSVAAFKIIREAYYRQLEERGNSENPQVAKWLVWRRQYNEQRVKAKARLASVGSSA